MYKPLKGLFACKKPFAIPALEQDCFFSMDASKNLIVRSKWGEQELLIYDMQKKETVVKEKTEAPVQFVKFLGDTLYTVSGGGFLHSFFHDFEGVLSVYDRDQKKLIPLKTLPPVQAGYNIIRVCDNKIAMTGLKAEKVYLYDTDKKTGRELDLGIEGLEAKSLDTQMIFLGDRFYFSFDFSFQKSELKETPFVLAVLDLNSGESETLCLTKKPQGVIGNEQQLIAFFIHDPDSRKDWQKTLRSWDPETFEINYTLNEKDYPILKTKGLFPDFMTLYENRLYICNNGLFQIFNADGSLYKELKRKDGTLWKTTSAVAFHGNVMAIGVIRPDKSYAVELWIDDKCVHVFPAHDLVTQLNFQFEGTVQLTVGLVNGVIEVWTPHIEEAQVVSDGLVLRAWYAVRNYLGYGKS